MVKATDQFGRPTTQKYEILTKTCLYNFDPLKPP